MLKNGYSNTFRAATAHWAGEGGEAGVWGQN
jgi:hypothetical protein